MKPAVRTVFSWWLLVPTLAVAQPFAEGFGILYVTTDIAADPFDPLENVAACIDDPGLPPFVPIEFFVVVDLDFADIGPPELNAVNGLSGWEARVNVPEELVITACPVNPHRPGPLNGCANFIVGTGITIVADSMPFALVEYTGILLAEAKNLFVTLTART